MGERVKVEWFDSDRINGRAIYQQLNNNPKFLNTAISSHAKQMWININGTMYRLTLEKVEETED